MANRLPIQDFGILEPLMQAKIPEDMWPVEVVNDPGTYSAIKGNIEYAKSQPIRRIAESQYTSIPDYLKEYIPIETLPVSMVKTAQGQITQQAAPLTPTINFGAPTATAQGQVTPSVAPMAPTINAPVQTASAGGLSSAPKPVAPAPIAPQATTGLAKTGDPVQPAPTPTGTATSTTRITKAQWDALPDFMRVSIPTSMWPAEAGTPSNGPTNTYAAPTQAVAQQTQQMSTAQWDALPDMVKQTIPANQRPAAAGGYNSPLEQKPTPDIANSGNLTQMSNFYLTSKNDPNKVISNPAVTGSYTTPPGTTPGTVDYDQAHPTGTGQPSTPYYDENGNRLSVDTKTGLLYSNAPINGTSTPAQVPAITYATKVFDAPTPETRQEVLSPVIRGLDSNQTQTTGGSVGTPTTGGGNPIVPAVWTGGPYTGASGTGSGSQTTGNGTTQTNDQYYGKTPTQIVKQYQRPEVTKPTTTIPKVGENAAASYKLPSNLPTASAMPKSLYTDQPNEYANRAAVNQSNAANTMKTNNANTLNDKGLGLAGAGPNYKTWSETGYSEKTPTYKSASNLGTVPTMGVSGVQGMSYTSLQGSVYANGATGINQGQYNQAYGVTGLQYSTDYNKGINRPTLGGVTGAGTGAYVKQDLNTTGVGLQAWTPNTNYNDINKVYDLQKQQTITQATEDRNKTLKDLAAKYAGQGLAGGAPSGAERTTDVELRKALYNRLGSYDIQQAQATEQRASEERNKQYERENVLGGYDVNNQMQQMQNAFARDERLGTQSFSAAEQDLANRVSQGAQLGANEQATLQAALDRNFTQTQRLGTAQNDAVQQDIANAFARQEREGAQVFSAQEQDLANRFQNGERLGEQEQATLQAALDRTQTATQATAGRQFEQQQSITEQEFAAAKDQLARQFEQGQMDQQQYFETAKQLSDRYYQMAQTEQEAGIAQDVAAQAAQYKIDELGYTTLSNERMAAIKNAADLGSQAFGFQADAALKGMEIDAANGKMDYQYQIDESNASYKAHLDSLYARAQAGENIDINNLTPDEQAAVMAGASGMKTELFAQQREDAVAKRNALTLALSSALDKKDIDVQATMIAFNNMLTQVDAQTSGTTSGKTTGTAGQEGLTITDLANPAAASTANTLVYSKPVTLANGTTLPKGTYSVQKETKTETRESGFGGTNKSTVQVDYTYAIDKTTGQKYTVGAEESNASTANKTDWWSNPLNPLSEGFWNMLS
jgi:ribosome assembly protein YihI (activator of Der GTPase)